VNLAQLEHIVDAVLYEGYILYPYRATSKKNQRERFTFGRIYPESYSGAQHGAEPFLMQTECLLTAGNDGVLTASVRFLQPMLREIGELIEPMAESIDLEPKFRLVPELRVENQLFQTWHEAVERRVEIPPLILKRSADIEQSQSVPIAFPAVRHLEPIVKANGEAVGVAIRSQPGIDGSVEISAHKLEADTIKVTVRILNQTPMTESELLEPEAVLERTFASTHTILSIQGGEFISSVDPGDAFKAAARSCKNIGTWPVLIGDEGKRERSTMLSSPIILYDYPKIAGESAGNLFDGTEIDEILSLRLQTLTDAEKFEMRNIDKHARGLLERTDALPDDAFLKMHGAMRKGEGGGPIEFDDFFGASTRLESVTVAGVQLKAGDRVRIQPNARADVMDVALAGQTAIIEAIEQDLEKRVHLALVLENDPGMDLGMMRQPGHRFFYGIDEVEPLVEELT
jgi:hypothetical protein